MERNIVIALRGEGGGGIARVAQGGSGTKASFTLRSGGVDAALSAYLIIGSHAVELPLNRDLIGILPQKVDIDGVILCKAERGGLKFLYEGRVLTKTPDFERIKESLRLRYLSNQTAQNDVRAAFANKTEAVQAETKKVGATQTQTAKISALQQENTKVGATQTLPTKVSVAQQETAKVGVIQTQPAKVSAAQKETVKVGATQPLPAKVSAAQETAKVESAQTQPSKVSAAQQETVKAGAAQTLPTKVSAAQETVKAESAQTQPSKVSAVQQETVKAGATQTQSTKVSAAQETAKAESAQTQPSKVSAVQQETVKAGATQTQSTKVSAAQQETAKAGTTQALPTKVSAAQESAKVEVAQVQPAKVSAAQETAKVESAQTQPAKVPTAQTKSAKVDSIATETEKIQGVQATKDTQPVMRWAKESEQETEPEVCGQEDIVVRRREMRTLRTLVPPDAPIVDGRERDPLPVFAPQVLEQNEQSLGTITENAAPNQSVSDATLSAVPIKQTTGIEREVRELFDVNVSANGNEADTFRRHEPVSNPFPEAFPQSAWVRVRYPGTTRYYLEGEVVNENGRFTIHALPGEYAPVPPNKSKGFTRFLRASDGSGYWLRIRRK